MKPFTLTAALAAAVGLAGSAAAWDCSGCYDVDGRYSNGVRTDAEIEFESVNGTWIVTRRGELTSSRYRHLPGFTWTSSSVQQLSRTHLRGVYTLATDQVGASGRLRGRSGGGANVLVADYVFTNRGRRLRERVINQTRSDPEDWWSSLTTDGRRERSRYGRSTGTVVVPRSRVVVTNPRGHHRRARTRVVYGNGTTIYTHPTRRSRRSSGVYVSPRVHRSVRVGRRGVRTRTHSSVTIGSRSGNFGISFTIGSGRSRNVGHRRTRVRHRSGFGHRRTRFGR